MQKRPEDRRECDWNAKLLCSEKQKGVGGVAKREEEDHPDHDVVLPAGPSIVPEDESLQAVGVGSHVLSLAFGSMENERRRLI